MYWITYILVPVVAGVLAASGFNETRRPHARAGIVRLARYKRIAGVGLLACGLWNGVEFVSIVGELSAIGRLLFLLVLIAELGLGLLFALDRVGSSKGDARLKGAELRRRLDRVEVPLGVTVIGTGLVMLLVRSGLLEIFG